MAVFKTGVVEMLKLVTRIIAMSESYTTSNAEKLGRNWWECSECGGRDASRSCLAMIFNLSCLRVGVVSDPTDN